jgi:hypothetical protein
MSLAKHSQDYSQAFREQAINMIPTALGTHARNWVFGGHIRRHTPVNLAVLGVFAYGSHNNGSQSWRVSLVGCVREKSDDVGLSWLLDSDKWNWTHLG